MTLRAALRGPRSIPAWLLLGAAGIGACGGDTAKEVGVDAEAPEAAPPTDLPAPPAFEVADLGALTRRIDAFAKASPDGLMVNLWATWCAPCLAEMPALHAFAADSDLPVWTISVDLAMPFEIETPEAVAAFAREREITLPTLLYEGELLALVEHYDLPAGVVPQTLVFDAQGALVAQHIGEADRETFAELAGR